MPYFPRIYQLEVFPKRYPLVSGLPVTGTGKRYHKLTSFLVAEPFRLDVFQKRKGDDLFTGYAARQVQSFMLQAPVPSQTPVSLQLPVTLLHPGTAHPGAQLLYPQSPLPGPKCVQEVHPVPVHLPRYLAHVCASGAAQSQVSVA